MGPRRLGQAKGSLWLPYQGGLTVPRKAAHPVHTGTRGPAAFGLPEGSLPAERPCQRTRPARGGRCAHSEEEGFCRSRMWPPGRGVFQKSVHSFCKYHLVQETGQRGENPEQDPVSPRKAMAWPGLLSRHIRARPCPSPCPASRSSRVRAWQGLTNSFPASSPQENR